jgi:Tfp pilus assembly protein PilE
MRNRKGQTLFEAILAVIIVAVIAMVVMEFYVTNKRLIQRNKLRVMAANFARETMESLYTKSLTDIETIPFNAQIKRTTDMPDFPYKASVPLGLPSSTTDMPSLGELKKHNPQRYFTVTHHDVYDVITVTVTWN